MDRCKLGDLAAQNETDDADDKPEQEWNAPVLCVQRLGRHQLRDRRSSINAAANWRDFSKSGGHLAVVYRPYKRGERKDRTTLSRCIFVLLSMGASETAILSK